MFSNTSITIGHSAAEIRTTRSVRGVDGESRTIRVRPGRSNTRRSAIAASLGYDR
ncbi:hypothetical protein ABT336_12090 [Micromonospora sp. NPDC000207]|uniref:hypothetical protein n=1 Tax=Micromonospora sp. NPDC000207 TaxID=3154246 RepID=UPI003330A907